MSKTSGVHHVAVGVKNLESMKAFYRSFMGFTEVFAEFEESEQEIMREVARSSRVVFSGAILGQRADGILFELIQMVEPQPRSIRKDFRYGDIGVGKVMVAVADVSALYDELKDSVTFCSTPKRTVVPGWGNYAFVYLRDPEGNLLELFSTEREETQDRFGGVRGIGIGVTDLDRSIAFYGEHLGFEVMVKPHYAFSGLVDEMSGATDTQVRSCLLTSGGGHSNMIELFEVSRPRGRSIPFAAQWGDYGYLQVAFNCDNVQGMASRLEDAGMDLMCSPKKMEGGIPDHPGEFVYARDPDGIPIEFLFLPL